MPGLVNEHAILIENEQLAERLFFMRLESPTIAAAVRPGQFVHMRIPGIEGHVLRRPFSIYDADSTGKTIDILYQVVGFGTDAMTHLKPGTEETSIELVGPVGNTWTAAQWTARDIPKRALLVGGGVGAAPLYMLTKHLKSIGASVDVVLGAQTKEAHVTLEKYTDLLGYEPFCSTDDGSYGHHGFATALVEERLAQGSASDGTAYDYVAVCGPPPLMRIVAAKACEADVYCEVSLEKLMACGIGACLSCVVDTVAGKKRVCVDGPIFAAEEVTI